MVRAHPFCIFFYFFKFVSDQIYIKDFLNLENMQLLYRNSGQVFKNFKKHKK